EQERHISFLKEALDKAGHREEDLKNMHNNYFLQVQTLINQKAIGSPKEAIRKKQEETGSNQEENRKFQEASRPAQKESRYREKEERLFDVDLEESLTIKKSPDIEHEVKPEVLQEGKAQIEKICKNCLQPFFTENPKKKLVLRSVDLRILEK
ncbi:MAG: hypothetical protein NHB15_06570, partial [Methanosarcina barkeri]|nr:hypothetical protein [Methanosarcina sp. ERenArc_MAG2]